MYSLFFLEALNDSTNAIQLDETNIKAYLRKGTALYHQNLQEEALNIFSRGLEIDCKLIQNNCFNLFYVSIDLF